MVAGATEGFTSYSVDNDRRFKEAVARSAAEVTDLTIPLTFITKDFFRSQRAIWSLASKGQYPDLAPRTKNLRSLRGQPYYPILRRTGALERSMTDPKDSNAVAWILNKKQLVLGTKIEYGVYHQSDRPHPKVPLRKFLFIGPEAPQFASSDQMGRMERWLGSIQGHVAQVLEQRMPKVSA